MHKTKDYNSGSILYDSLAADCIERVLSSMAQLMTQLLTDPIFSMFPCKEMTFRILIQDGTASCHLQVKFAS